MRPNAVPVLHWLVENEIGYNPRTVPVQSPLQSPSSPRLALAGKAKISYTFKENEFIYDFFL